MEPEDRDRWDLFNRQAKIRYRTTPCQDCTPAFAAEMRLVNLCNGEPGPQRYCVHCQRWWLMDNWGFGQRGYFCLVCHRKQQAARTYRRIRDDPVRWPARKAKQRERDAARMTVISNRARKNALDRDRKRTKYQSDPAWRAMVLARNRAARVREKVMPGVSAGQST